MSKISSLVFLKIGTKILVGETSNSLSSTSDMIDVSSKVSGRARNIEYGRISQTISVSSIGTWTPPTTEYGFQDAITAQNDGTKATVTITNYTDKTAATEVVGDTIFSGTALLSDVTLDQNDNEAQTFSATLEIDGLLTSAVNAS